MTRFRFMRLTSQYLTLALSLLFLLSAGCIKKTRYEHTVDKELAKKERNDEIFLGFHFGMPSQDFYEKCWELNKSGLAREGALNTTVYYEIDDLSYKSALEFYPVFKDDKIQSMTGFAHYIGWAPWNKHLWAESMIEELKTLFESWYGPGFFRIKSPGRGAAYVKIDGNRRIVLYYNRDERVEFLFSDLTNEDNILTLKSKT